MLAEGPAGHPILLRTSDKAGHGIGRSLDDHLDEQIALEVDIYTFLLGELGLD